ncbi:hypothetical protein Tco_0438230 [Tanacetum coccineum]
MTVGEVNTRVTELAELHEHDTQDLYALLEYAHDSRSRISQRVDMDLQRVDLHMRDRMTLQETIWMVHETRFQMQQAELVALRETDCRRQAQMPRPDARSPDHQDASGDADITAALPSPPLPPLPPSLYIPPPVDRRDDIPEFEQPPRKRLCLSTLGSRYEVGESSTARPARGRGIDYRFVSIVDAEERR